MSAPDRLTALRRSGYRPVYPWLSPRALAILNKAAQERGQHPCQLAARILETVLEEALTAAVLDL
jgi:hypothetical protein